MEFSDLRIWLSKMRLFYLSSSFETFVGLPLLFLRFVVGMSIKIDNVFQEVFGSPLSSRAQYNLVWGEIVLDPGYPSIDSDSLD